MQDNYENVLVNSKIIDMKRSNDLIKILFLSPDKIQMQLEATCFVRMYDCSGLLSVCSLDLLHRSPNSKKKWYKRYNWTKIGSTIFDDALIEYIKNIYSLKVSKVILEGKDLRIFFEKGNYIEMVADATKYNNEIQRQNYKLIFLNSK